MCVILYTACTLQSAFYSGQARIVQIDFSAAFNVMGGILYKLCSVGIGGSVLSIFTHFLSNQSKHFIVDCCPSEVVNVVSGM